MVYHSERFEFVNDWASHIHTRGVLLKRMGVTHTHSHSHWRAWDWQKAGTQLAKWSGVKKQEGGQIFDPTPPPPIRPVG